MTVHRPILREALLFLAAVIAVLSVGAFVIVDRVTRSGLEDVFRQRIERSQIVLAEYAKSHLLARSTEMEAVLTSPRFLAAIETGDAETIAREVPTHAAILGSDFLVIENSSGALLYGSPGLDPELSARVRERLSAITAGVDVAYVPTPDGVVEVAFAPVEANNGATLGRIASGTALSAPYAEALARLTGCEVLLTQNGRIVGSTEFSPLAAVGAGSEDPIELPSGRIDRVALGGQGVLAFRVDDPTTGLTVTFLASVDDAIRPIVAKVRLLLLALAAGGAGLALFVLSRFTSRRVGRQVSALVGHAERIAREDLEFTIRPTSEDEFGYLAGEMEKMRARLQAGRSDLERAHADRLTAEKMAALGRVAAGIIHDLKNPMAVIRGTAELSERRDEANEKLRRQCSTIRQQVDRMTSLTRDVLEYSSGKSFLEVETVELRAYLEELREFHLESFGRAGVKLEIEASPHVHVLLDPTRMRRVLDNLVVTAREVSRVGDRVAVRGSAPAGRGVRLEITDEGPGVPAELLPSLFEPFVTSGKDGGTGLGLAIAKKIVEDHGGSIEAGNLPNRGARFTITLPEKLRTTEIARTVQESVA